MGMAVYIENQIHQRVKHVLDDSNESFMRMCEAGPTGSVRRFISRHGDTMLNVFQLRLLINEIRSLPVELATPTVKKVEEAAEQAIRLRGYLYFVGD